MWTEVGDILILHTVGTLYTSFTYIWWSLLLTLRQNHPVLPASGLDTRATFTLGAQNTGELAVVRWALDIRDFLVKSLLMYHTECLRDAFVNWHGAVALNNHALDISRETWNKYRRERKIEKK